MLIWLGQLCTKIWPTQLIIDDKYMTPPPLKKKYMTPPKKKKSRRELTPLTLLYKIPSTNSKINYNQNWSNYAYSKNVVVHVCKHKLITTGGLLSETFWVESQKHS